MVVAITVLCCVPDAILAVREMVRVLRPGGHIVIGELGRYSTWAVKRRLSGWLGSRTWRSAAFRSGKELKQSLGDSGLTVTELRGAIYYPPVGVCARFLAAIDSWLGRRTIVGAAFLAISATKPAQGQSTTGLPA